MLIHRLLNYCIVCVFSVFIGVGFAQSQENVSVFEYQLKNGLKILVKPVSKAPVVTSQLWYKVGSSYEHSGISGISHMLEHMMFKGTKKFPGGTLSATVAKLGGNHNAFTGRDYTAYYQNISTEHLEKMLELEADRMQGIVWNEDEFGKEVKVVMEERRLRTDDKPNNRLYELFFMNTFSVNPYRIPVIGWMDDITSYQMRDAIHWFDQWYVPNNAVLVVVGAVEPEKVKQMAERYFADIPAREIATIKPRVEHRQLVKRRIEIEDNVNYAYLMMGYRVPSLPFVLNHSENIEEDKKDVFALELISAVLSSGGSSRLQNELVRKQRVVIQSGAFYQPYSRLETVFVLDGVTAEGYDASDMEQALLAQIKKLQTQKVSPQELLKVKNQIKAQKIYQKDSLFYQGYELGALESIGLSWREGEKYVQYIDEVSAEDILRASKKYFIPENQSIAVLQPQQQSKETGKTKQGEVSQ